MTPEELGRTQAIIFTIADHAIPSADGEHLALQTYAPLEPDPSYAGTRAVFSRTARGWTARSLVAPGAAARQLPMTTSVLSPDLSRVAFESFAFLNQEESPLAYEVGPVGGPYALMAETPAAFETNLSGANSGTASVPAFTDVLFESTDHQLLPKGPERIIAEEAERRAFDLYDWSGGTLRLVNVEGSGSHLEPLSTCRGGGQLGGGPEDTGPGAVGAVSADGSKVFFTSCGRLYMRVDGRETVEVSAPAPGVVLNPSERAGVNYNAATPDGSEVVFNTATPLLAGETTSENRLFIYDTITGDLRLIRSGVPVTKGTEGRYVLLSEDGSAVYYNRNESIYRYETQTGKTSFVAAIHTPTTFNEPSYTTPNGQFLVFVGGPGGVRVAGPLGLELESRGAVNNELYRYDAADGSVMCVSCGEGSAPAEGFMTEPTTLTAFRTDDGMPPFIQISENGQKVFFETTAQLVPQDTNSTESGGSSSLPGMDVYEWEANGAEEAPGVFCRLAVGCTHLITTGEDVGKSTFLGASQDGRNVFFATAARLVPQATPEFPNIYDARVDGGFAPPVELRPCLSCQGVGSVAPLFGPGASGTFAGPGNIAASSSTAVVSPAPAHEEAGPRCAESRKRNVAHCARANGKGKRKRKRKGRSRAAGRVKSRKGGGRS
ncbi:MAG: TolB family protein [Solirubrobacteraceae bacterium]